MTLILVGIVGDSGGTNFNILVGLARAVVGLFVFAALRLRLGRPPQS